MTEMFTAMEAELAGLKIPFFGTYKHLIKESPEPSEDEPKISTSNEDGSITPAELKVLQKRICELLEDLCNDG